MDTATKRTGLAACFLSLGLFGGIAALISLVNRPPLAVLSVLPSALGRLSLADVAEQLRASGLEVHVGKWSILDGTPDAAPWEGTACFSVDTGELTRQLMAVQNARGLNPNLPPPPIRPSAAELRELHAREKSLSEALSRRFANVIRLETTADAENRMFRRGEQLALAHSNFSLYRWGAFVFEGHPEVLAKIKKALR